MIRSRKRLIELVTKSKSFLVSTLFHFEQKRTSLSLSTSCSSLHVYASPDLLEGFLSSSLRQSQQALDCSTSWNSVCSMRYSRSWVSSYFYTFYQLSCTDSPEMSVDSYSTHSVHNQRLVELKTIWNGGSSLQIVGPATTGLYPPVSASLALLSSRLEQADTLQFSRKGLCLALHTRRRSSFERTAYHDRNWWR